MKLSLGGKTGPRSRVFSWPTEPKKTMDIQQVAKRAKVSTATVSRVLNRSSNVREKTSAHVRRIIEELNYVPNTNARNLRVGRTRLFGLIISDINNPFFPELIDAFEGLAAEQGIEVIFTHTNYDPRRLQNCVRRLVERNVDAIAIMTSEVDEQALQEATKVQLPLVLLNQRSLQDKYRNVMVEYSRGFQEAVEHLRALGHTAIGFIAGPSHLRSAQRRREAFCLALKRCSLEVCPEWIATTDLRVEGGKIAMQQLLALGHRPTAVVTTNDLMAVGALQAAHLAGVSVPKDLSVIGFDDLPIADMTFPALTTIRLPRSEIAHHAFISLLEGIRTTKVTPCPVVYPRLIIRQSTAPVARTTGGSREAKLSKGNFSRHPKTLFRTLKRRASTQVEFHERHAGLTRVAQK